MQPDWIPGRASGSTMRRNVTRQVAPSDRPAASSAGSMVCSAAMTGRIMKGRKTWVRAMTMPSVLYISGSGARVRPSDRAALLRTPLLPSRMVQPKLRTTIPTSSGDSTMPYSTGRQRDRLRASCQATGKPTRSVAAVVSSAIHSVLPSWPR